MEIIRSKNVDLDMNSNVFKESGYWPTVAASSAVNKAGKGNDLIGAGLVDLYDSESPELSATVRSVSLHLEQCLRAAKKVHLSCGEVLLPPDLLTRVARDIIRMAETEPCGLRGGLILINFENGNASASGQNNPSMTSNNNSSSHHRHHRKDLHSSNSSLNSTSSSGSSDSGSTASSQGSSTSSSSIINSSNARNIGKIRWDAQTVTTFELHLTLREDLAPWYSRLPQILRNLTKGGTIVVSPAYTIAKKKLYRSH